MQSREGVCLNCRPDRIKWGYNTLTFSAQITDELTWEMLNALTPPQCPGAPDPR